MLGCHTANSQRLAINGQATNMIRPMRGDLKQRAELKLDKKRVIFLFTLMVGWLAERLFSEGFSAADFSPNGWFADPPTYRPNLTMCFGAMFSTT